MLLYSYFQRKLDNWIWFSLLIYSILIYHSPPPPVVLWHLSIAFSLDSLKTVLLNFTNLLIKAPSSWGECLHWTVQIGMLNTEKRELFSCNIHPWLYKVAACWRQHLKAFNTFGLNYMLHNSAMISIFLSQIMYIWTVELQPLWKHLELYGVMKQPN